MVFFIRLKDNITIDKYEDNFFGKYKIGEFRTSSSNEFKQIKHKEKTNLISIYLLS